MGRSRVALATAALVAGSLSGCGVVLDAPEVTLLVRDNAIVFSGPQDRDALVAGEVKLVIRNDGANEHRVVLAQIATTRPEQLPRSMAKAEFARDDDRILAVTKDLKPKEATFAGGGLGYKIDSARMHVHLRPGEPYVLFDSLKRGSLEGVFLRFVPKRAP